MDTTLSVISKLSTLTEGFGGKDFIIIFMLSVPFFLLYCVSVFIYMKTIDKITHNKLARQKKGLSRMVLGGIFFMFGLILFDIIVEFILAFSIDINTSEKFITGIGSSSIIIKNVFKTSRIFPIKYLIWFTIICTAVYTGTEGAISSLKTMNVPEGIVIELPYIKRKRLSMIFYCWAYISALATIYTVIVGSSDLDFDLVQLYSSLGLTLLIIFIAERSSATLAHVDKSKNKTNKIVNVVVPCEDKKDSMINSIVGVIADKIIEEKEGQEEERGKL